ncbi:MAG: tyrosine-type recombinase/integrase [Bacillota bacterium]
MDKDVDFKRKLIHVRSSEKFQTKTVNSERSIPMTKELYKLLTEVKAKSKSEYVFASTQGFQVRERRTLQICKKVAENAKIKSNAYLHKFRHTYATILVQKGERLEDIKELLGHSTITETEIYAHHRSDQLHDRVIHLDNIFSKKKGQS